MNREIKFRAWDNHNKRMCQPYFEFRRNESNLTSIEHSPTGGYYMTEIMQYTGLKDKNGKEIYEGDVFLNAWPVQNKFVNEVVVFKEGCFWLYTNERTHSNTLNYPDGCWPLFKYNTEMWLEVIGNIYQNPEYLK